MATKQSGARAAGVTAVIGAGPHGLAATAHLRAAGLDVRTFGEPLEFWQRHMPAGMLLRSRKRIGGGLLVRADHAVRGAGCGSPSKFRSA